MIADRKTFLKKIEKRKHYNYYYNTHLWIQNTIKVVIYK